MSQQVHSQRKKTRMTHEDEQGPPVGRSRSREEERRTGEAGFIIIGGGGRGFGKGCLFWILVSIVLSVTLTVLANLILAS